MLRIAWLAANPPAPVCHADTNLDFVVARSGGIDSGIDRRAYGKKMEAAQALEGKFSAEGLASIAGEEGSAEMALAKSLADRIDEGDAARHWAKVGGRVASVAGEIDLANDISAFDEGTLAMLRAAFGRPSLQVAG